MIAPVKSLKKSEILKLAGWRCKHRHTGLEHYKCYLKEHPDKIKIGFFDIETSNLKADFGIMLSYAIKVAKIDKYYYSYITKEDLIKHLDKSIVKKCIEDLQRFDIIVTYYGTGFDIPFVRTRALEWGIEFPFYGAILHKDVYYMARSKLRLSRNRLDNVCRLFGIKGKTHIEAKHWIRALQGNAKSIQYIMNHNLADVEILEKAYYKLLDYVKGTNRSI